MKYTKLQISISGRQRYLDARVVLSDLALKLSGKTLASGEHEIIIYPDGSVELDSVTIWTPKPPKRHKQMAFNFEGIG